MLVEIPQYGQFDIRRLRESVKADSDDIVVISGTLLEGYGNAMSDFDVYVICERRPAPGGIDPTQHALVMDCAGTWRPPQRADIASIFDYMADADFAVD